MTVSLHWVDEEDLLFTKLLDLRWRVLREPLGMERGTENNFLDGKPRTTHLVAVNNSNVVGTITIWMIPNSNQVRLDQVCVDVDWQKKGVGSKLVKEFLRVIQNKSTVKTTNKTVSGNYNSIFVHSRVSAVKFYQSLGFEIEGESFLEVGIPHINMTINFDDEK
ncbi:glucosamine 6-phosphate n-acetyltransferase [Anaeramoeba flamelloides]|uniref:Glucosamine 6-phosphate n-acetyltransferase n=1 Tax=Anaeramoeba flamelloides TaxID=1746091 RepID=A0AAV7ZML1_9EUKA|nr:glucosamine 6-phosphate n-acetyltransferase [Anaeramoeba flamelloides]KAJ6231762.1 glucosamine 6-phosphate n-acetyltransferase [Anaeramoeba flamelloides]